MNTDWFKARRYKHFDRPVGVSFAQKIMNPDFVERHSFSPLIHYTKKTKRYKPTKEKTEYKNRPIMYASHRDACILSYYSHILNEQLDKFYEEHSLSDCVIAYRSLGQGNYDFSATANKFAIKSSPCVILAFDVSGFFDNLDHALLKSRLKKILGVKSLPNDWYKVFRYTTKYCYVEIEHLRAHPAFAEAFHTKGSGPIARVEELKAEDIKFYRNQAKVYGIPQGTPISAALSNLYMIDFDMKIRTYCDSIDALYRRYSDDILIICPKEKADDVEKTTIDLIVAEKLQISQDKTERTLYQRHQILTRKGFPFEAGCDSRVAREIRHVGMHCSSRRLRQYSASALGHTQSRPSPGSAAFSLGGRLRRHEPRGRREGWRHGSPDAQGLGAPLQ